MYRSGVGASGSRTRSCIGAEVVQWASRHAEDGIAVKPHGSTRVAGWIVQRGNSRRWLAEEALLESERKYRMLIKGGVKDCAILMLGPNGEIRSWKCGAGHACC
jgi:hypothetical protein